MEKQKTPDSQSIPEQKEQYGGIAIPDFKLYYRATVIKTAWYWHKNRPVDHWNKIEDPNLSTSNFSHLIFNKGAMKTQWTKEVIQQMVLA